MRMKYVMNLLVSLKIQQLSGILKIRLTLLETAWNETTTVWNRGIMLEHRTCPFKIMGNIKTCCQRLYYELHSKEIRFTEFGTLRIFAFFSEKRKGIGLLNWLQHLLELNTYLMCFVFLGITCNIFFFQDSWPWSSGQRTVHGRCRKCEWFWPFICWGATWSWKTSYHSTGLFLSRHNLNFR